MSDLQHIKRDFLNRYNNEFTIEFHHHINQLGIIIQVATYKHTHVSATLSNNEVCSKKNRL